MSAAALASGKDHTKENFPVASFVLKREHRAPIMTFYRFARAADDVADHATVSAAERLVLLDEMRATLIGTSDVNEEARALRETLAKRGLTARHGLDLIAAFEQDCRVDCYPTWDALIDYCRLSAMPVGRYVLDVHGEDRAVWGASDALCAALQVINHVQDCARDYRALGRTYLPLDMLAAHGASVDDLAAAAATPGLRATIVTLATRTDALLRQSAGFAVRIRDRRLGVEVAIIHRLAVSLNQRLKRRDPLSQRVHHRAPEALGLAALAALSPAGRPVNPGTTPAALQAQVSGSSFYAGMRVLPKAEREAMYAVYAFCRAVDDIADDEQGDRADRAAALDTWRADIESLYAGGDPGQAALVAEAVRRFGLAKADFLAVIDGMAMDVAGDIRWPAFATLDLYCDRVASAVGRLSVRIFGMEEEPGLALAHHLGRALQLTNILRDVDEDAAIGRVYLAAEHLSDAGIVFETPEQVVNDPRLDGPCRDLAVVAHQHYRAAHTILAKRPRGHLIAPRLMEAVYAKILARMEVAGWAPPRARIKVNKATLILTAARLSLFR